MINPERHLRNKFKKACDDYYDCLLRNVSTDMISLIEKEKEEMNTTHMRASMTIKNVIFSNPATIVFWMDGTKTVVKCQKGDIYDPEKGLAMAIAKKALGNKGNYCNVFDKWLPEVVKENDILDEDEPKTFGLRQWSADICDLFEEVLEQHDVTIPDVEREGLEDEARLYGNKYDLLENDVTRVLKKMIETRDECPNATIEDSMY